MFGHAFVLCATGGSVRLEQVTAIGVLIALFIVPTGASSYRHRQKMRVHFLANSAVIRSTWYWNEDRYLAELSLPRRNESIFVRLVDVFPNEAPPSLACGADVRFRNRSSSQTWCQVRPTVWRDSVAHRARRSDGNSTRTTQLSTRAGPNPE